MNQRIREFLLAENKSSAQLAEEIGVQPSGISHILSGRNKPSLDFILKMLEKYTFLSTDWLLFGTGRMYNDSKEQSLFDEDPDYKEEVGEEMPGNKQVVSDIEMSDALNDKVANDLSADAKVSSPVVVKIVWFYDNNSFKEYFPGK